jgi:hypothetical protein
MNKKLIALFLICSILGSSTSALATTNSNTVLPTPVKRVSVAYLGGGPSPSATWTYKCSTNKVFTRSQIQSLYNQAYAAHVAGETSNKAYNFALVILGFCGYTSPIMSAYLGFCTSNEYTLIQTSMNTLGRALACGHAKVTIEILTWERPANGAKLCAFNSLP